MMLLINRSINAKANHVRGLQTLIKYYKAYREQGYSKFASHRNSVLIAEGGWYLSI